MARTMYDSVTPGAIPSTATMVAGYVDGLYSNVNAMRARFPKAQLVEIAVSSHTDAGQVLDVETGDATPSGAVSWVQMRRRAGADPTVYCNESVWPSVKSAFRTANVKEPHYWVASWDGNPTIPAGAVAKQYKNSKMVGHNYDVSSISTYWPGVDAPVSNPLPPAKNDTHDYTKDPGFGNWSYKHPVDAPHDAWGYLIDIYATVHKIAQHLGLE